MTVNKRFADYTLKIGAFFFGLSPSTVEKYYIFEILINPDPSARKSSAEIKAPARCVSVRRPFQRKGAVLV